MALNTSGLRRLDASGLEPVGERRDDESGDLDVSGLRPLDPSGLTSVGERAPETVADRTPPPRSERRGGGFANAAQAAPEAEDRDEDSWLDLAKSFFSTTGPAWRRIAGGMVRSLGEGGASPGGTAGLAMTDYQLAEREAIQRERVDAEGGLDDFGAEVFEAAQADLESRSPNIDPESLKGYAYDIAVGVRDMIPAVAASLATRSPAPGMAIIGAQVGGSRYGESRAEGRSTQEAAMDAAFYSAAEALPEALPLGVLIKPGGKFLGRVLKAAGAEGIQEMFTEALQTGYDTGLLDEDMSWAQAWNNIQRAGIVGAGVGAGLAVGTQPFRGREPEAPVDPETGLPQGSLDASGLYPVEASPADAPQPTGERERARADTPPLTEADRASPIPDDLIAQGKAVLSEAMGQQSADQVLAELGVPKVGTRVRFDAPGGAVEGTIDDAIKGEFPGARIRLDDGETVEATGNELASRLTPLVAPEPQQPAPTAPSGSSPVPEGSPAGDTLSQGASSQTGAGAAASVPDRAQTPEGNSIPLEFINLFRPDGSPVSGSDSAVRAFKEQHGLGQRAIHAIQRAVLEGRGITIEDARAQEEAAQRQRDEEAAYQNSEEARAERQQAERVRVEREQAERDEFIASAGTIEEGEYQLDSGARFRVLSNGTVLRLRPDGTEDPYGSVAPGRSDDKGVGFASWIKDGSLTRAGESLPDVTAGREPPDPALVRRVSTAGGQSIDTAFEVVDASELVSSDDARFDQAIQPRQRGSRAASEAQVAKIAAEFDASRLAESAEADRGAPIIGPDNMVESGNGRVMAIRRVQRDRPEAAEAYRQMIEGMGLSTEGVENPVLVRRRITPLDQKGRRAFAIGANESATATMSPVERAMADADALDASVVEQYQPGAEIQSAANRGFVRAFLSKLPVSAQNELVDADGNLASTGIRRIQGALLGRAYGGRRESVATIDRILESTDDNVRSITGAMLDVAPEFARVRQSVDDGVLPADYDVSTDVVAAVEAVSNLRSQRRSVAEFLQQQGMFGNVSPVQQELIRAFYRDEGMTRAAGRDKIAAILRYYAQESSTARTDQGSMFGEEVAPPQPQEIIRAGRDRNAEAEAGPRPDAGGFFTAGGTVRGADAGGRAGPSPGAAPAVEPTGAPAEEVAPAAVPDGYVVKNDGTPFKTRQGAALAARSKKLEAVEPVEIEGGWALAPAEQAAPSAESAPPARQAPSDWKRPEWAPEGEGARPARSGDRAVEYDALQGFRVGDRVTRADGLVGTVRELMFIREQGGGDTGARARVDFDEGFAQFVNLSELAPADASAPAAPDAPDTILPDTDAAAAAQDAVETAAAAAADDRAMRARAEVSFDASTADIERMVLDVLENDADPAALVRAAVRDGRIQLIEGAEPAMADVQPLESSEIVPAPARITRAKDYAGAEITPEEAAERIEAWKAEAKRIGRETPPGDGQIILSLFDTSGTMAQPYRDMGYEVYQLDLKEGYDLLRGMPDVLRWMDEALGTGDRVVGVIAQPPCTTWAGSGARWWSERHDRRWENAVRRMWGEWAAKEYDSPVEYNQALVVATETIIGQARPDFFAIENPVGRIDRMAGLPDPRLVIQPHHFGAPYTKRTHLWGRFNERLPTANVDPSEGSRMHKLRGRDEKDGGLRSLTPEGFAYAFALANAPGVQVRADLPGMAAETRRGAIEARLSRSGDRGRQRAPRIERLQEMDSAKAKRLEADLHKGQGFTSLDDLMARMERHHDELTQEIARAAQAAGATPKVAPVKARDRVEEKVRIKYRGELNRIADVARGGITAASNEQADAFVDTLARRYRVIDEGWSFTNEGYFDRKLVVQFDDGTLGEVQIWPPGMLEAKEEQGGHALYEVVRSPNTAEQEKQEAIVAMRRLYGGVRDQLPGDWSMVIPDMAAGMDAPSAETALSNAAASTSGEPSSDQMARPSTAPQEPSSPSESMESADSSTAGMNPSTRKNRMGVTSADSIAPGVSYSTEIPAPATGGSMTAEAVSEAIADVTLTWEAGPRVEVLQSYRELPDGMAAQIEAQEAYDVGGLFVTVDGEPTVYLIADNLVSRAHARRTLAHEAIGHYGMERMLGDQFGQLIQRVRALKVRDASIREIAERVRRDYGELSPDIEAQEIIAKMAERRVRHPVLTRVRAALREFLRRLGFRVPFSRTELDAMLVRAGRMLVSGRGGAGVRYTPREEGRADDGQVQDQARDAGGRRGRADDRTIDLFAAAEVSGDTSPEGIREAAVAWSSVRTANETQRTVEAPLERIDNVDDVATMMSWLGRYANEQVQVLVTDANHRPLQIIRHSIGNQGAASVFPESLAGAIADVDGAAHAWMVHNHPSGGSSLSSADLKISSIMGRHLEAMGIRHQGIMAIGGSTGAREYSAQQPDAGMSMVSDQPVKPMPDKVGEGALPVPITERMIQANETVDDGTRLDTPVAVGTFLRKKGLDGPGVLAVDVRRRPVGWIPLDQSWIAREGLRGERARTLAKAITSTNAPAVFLSIGERPNARQAIQNVRPELANLTRALRVSAKDVLDIVALKPGSAVPVTDQELGGRALTAGGDPGMLFARMGALSEARGYETQKAWHGSPHFFERVDLGQVGTGEGAQAYGWGFYVAQERAVAEDYRDSINVRHWSLLGMRVGDQAATELSEDVQDELVSIAEGTAHDGSYDATLAGYIENADSTAERMRRMASDQPAGSTFRETLEEEARRSARRAERLRELQAMGSIQRAPNPAETRALYEVEVPQEGLLDWDAPLSEQPKGIKEAFRRHAQANPQDHHSNVALAAAEGLTDAYEGMTGSDLYARLRDQPHLLPNFKVGMRSDKAASDYLADMGIRGIQYLDQFSRNLDAGTRNVVVFDARDINVVSRNGEPVDAPAEQAEVRMAMSRTGGPRGLAARAADTPPPARAFFRDYAQHIDIQAGRRGDAAEVREAVLRDGFRASGRINATPPAQGGTPGSVVARAYALKPGQLVYFAPPDAWQDTPAGMKIRDGWQPKPWEAVVVREDEAGASAHDVFMRAWREANAADRRAEEQLDLVGGEASASQRALAEEQRQRDARRSPNTDVPDSLGGDLFDPQGADGGQGALFSRTGQDTLPEFAFLEDEAVLEALEDGAAQVVGPTEDVSKLMQQGYRIFDANEQDGDVMELYTVTRARGGGFELYALSPDVIEERGLDPAEVANPRIAAVRARADAMDPGARPLMSRDREAQDASDPFSDNGREARAKRAGRAFLSQPFDRAFRIPFDVFGGVDARGEWVPGRKLSDGAARVITSAKFDESGRFAWMNATMEKARAGLIDRYGLEDTYVERDRQRRVDEQNLVREAADVIKGLADAGVGTEEAQVLQRVLTGEAVADAEMANLAEPIRNAIDDMGAEAVRLGLISAESFERNRGAYLHRVYLRHENDQGALVRWVSRFGQKQRRKIAGEQFKGRGLWIDTPLRRLMANAPGFAEGERGQPQDGERFRVLDLVPETETVEGVEPGDAPRAVDRVYIPEGVPTPAQYRGYQDRGLWEVRGRKQGGVVLWRDFTKAERERMGEIVDARYTIARTYMGMAHDLATGRFFADIAKNGDWARTDEPRPSIWKDAAEYNRFWADPAIEWVRVPDTKIPKSDTKRYGALSGMFVRAEIWRDMAELDQLNRASTWDAVLRQWKVMKTARSPVVHTNNIVSNIVLMDLADVRMRDLAGGIRAMVKQTQDYRDAVDNGAFGSDMVAQELRRNVLEPLLEELERAQQGGEGSIEARFGAVGKVMDAIWSGREVPVGRGKKVRVGIKPFDRAMVNAYQLEDEVFRMATFMRLRSQGIEPAEAARRATDQFLNYDIRAPWVNAVRRTALPFISYTYRAVPVVAQSVALRPWKLAKYAAIAYGINAIGYMLEPGDEDEERRSLRDIEQGNTWIGAPRMIRAPWADPYGNPVFLDVRRWVPAGDVFDMNQGHSAIPIPAPLQFGGPLMLGAELALNKQAFTGREITNEYTDDWWDRTAKVADWGWKSWMPSAAWVPGSWYWSKIGNAVTGARDPQGRPYTLESALPSSFGVKFKPQDVDENFYWKGREFERVESELRSQLRRLERDYDRGMLSQSARERRRARIMEKFDELAESRAETFNPRE